MEFWGKTGRKRLDGKQAAEMEKEVRRRGGTWQAEAFDLPVERVEQERVGADAAAGVGGVGAVAGGALAHALRRRNGQAQVGAAAAVHRTHVAARLHLRGDTNPKTKRNQKKTMDFISKVKAQRTNHFLFRVNPANSSKETSEILFHLEKKKRDST